MKKNFALTSILGIILLIIILLSLKNIFLVAGFFAFLVVEVFIYRSLMKSKPKHEKIITISIVISDLIILAILIN